MDPLLDYVGALDAYGNVLHTTQIAVADELAATAELVTGKALGIPVTIIRGYEFEPMEDATIQRLLRSRGARPVPLVWRPRSIPSPLRERVRVRVKYPAPTPGLTACESRRQGTAATGAPSGSGFGEVAYADAQQTEGAARGELGGQAGARLCPGWARRRWKARAKVVCLVKVVKSASRILTVTVRPRSPLRSRACWPLHRPVPPARGAALPQRRRCRPGKSFPMRPTWSPARYVHWLVVLADGPQPHRLGSLIPNARLKPFRRLLRQHTDGGPLPRPLQPLGSFGPDAPQLAYGQRSQEPGLIPRRNHHQPVGLVQVGGNLRNRLADADADG